MNFQYVEMLEALQHNGSHQFLAEKNVQKLNWMVILKLTFLKKYRATKDFRTEAKRTSRNDKAST